MIKKWVFVLIIILLIPSVYSLTSQEWLNKHNFHPSNPVIIGPQISMQVTDSSGNVVLRDPMVGEDISFEVNEEGVYHIAYIFDDDFNLITNFNLNGTSFYGYKTWFHKMGGSSKINTVGWKPQDYHIISYTFKYDYTNNKYYDNSWKVYSFSLKTNNQPNIQGLSDPNNIGPKYDPNKVPGCITPPQPQTQTWDISKDTVLCPGSYNVSLGLQVIKDNVILDCNGAELIGTRNSPGTKVKILTTNTEVKNCILKDIDIEGYGVMRKFTIKNNMMYKSWWSAVWVVLSTKNSLIINNNFTVASLDVLGGHNTKEGENVIRNNNLFWVQINEPHKTIFINNELSELYISESSENRIENNKIILNNDQLQVNPLRLRDTNRNKINNNFISCKLKKEVHNGIDLSDTNENNIIKNTIEYCKVGISVSSPSEKNKFNNNNLIGNTFSYQDSTEGNNSYSNNYFDDYSPICKDVNNDNICDDPYIITTIPAQYSITGQPIVIQDSSPSKILN